MNYSVILAEFNPLTNGHKLIIDKTKEMFPNDGIIVIMSGNFVQRGEPAIVDKFKRAKSATALGVDVVIELPMFYAINSAEDFAFGGVKLASSITNATRIVFGSECGDINKLIKTAELLKSKQNDPAIKNSLNSGNSFASSIINNLPQEYQEIMSNPNNILAVEYIKAIHKLKSSLEPITIKRINNYNNTSLSSLPSASAIRQQLTVGNLNYITNLIPSIMHNNLKDINILDLEKLYSMLVYKIEYTPITELKNINGVTEGIEHRIKKAIHNSTSFDNLVENLSTKRYPKSKIKRILLSVLFGITKEDLMNVKQEPPYHKILSVGKNKQNILKDLSTCKHLICSNKDYISQPTMIQHFLDIENKADNIYSYVTNAKFDLNFKNKI